MNEIYNVFVEPVVLEIRVVKVERKAWFTKKIGPFFDRSTYKPRLKALLSSFNKPDFLEMRHSIITMFVAFEKKLLHWYKARKEKPVLFETNERDI